MIIEPIEDILSLSGSLKSYALKGKSAKKIAKIEKKAWGRAAVSRYKKTTQW